MEEQAYVQERKRRLKILRQPLLRKQAEWSCLSSKDKGFKRIVSKRDNRNREVLGIHLRKKQVPRLP